MVDSGTATDSLAATFSTGQQYLLMLSRTKPEDPRLANNILAEGSGKREAFPFSRENIYVTPEGFYDVVSIKPENQKLVSLIKQNIAKSAD